MLSFDKKESLEEMAENYNYSIDFYDEDGATSITLFSEDTKNEVDINLNDGMPIEFSECADENMKAICLFDQKLTCEEAEALATKLTEASELLRFIMREAEKYEKDGCSGGYSNYEEDDYED